MIFIGIDPGKHTGLAVWDSRAEKFLCVESHLIHKAIDRVREIHQAEGDNLFVIFEDSRQRKWFGYGNTKKKLKGAGSVNRDSTIWEDFLKDEKIAFRAVPPRAGMTGKSPEYMKEISGWDKRTSDHSRDAMMLVYGK